MSSKYIIKLVLNPVYTFFKLLLGFYMRHFGFLQETCHESIMIIVASLELKTIWFRKYKCDIETNNIYFNFLHLCLPIHNILWVIHIVSNILAVIITHFKRTVLRILTTWSTVMTMLLMLLVTGIIIAIRIILGVFLIIMVIYTRISSKKIVLLVFHIVLKFNII